MDRWEWVRVYARSCMEGITHGWDHVLRVESNARRIATKEQVDWEILILSVWLHDIGRSRGEGDHAEIGAGMAESFLREGGVAEDIVHAVGHAVRTHRYRTLARPETREAQVLSDADKLDAMGLIGAVRAVAHAVEHGQPIHMPVEKARNLGTHPANLEYEIKLKHLAEHLYTDAAKDMARTRMVEMERFFGNLAQECDGNDL